MSAADVADQIQFVSLNLQCGPPVISWFISPSNYSCLRTINHSYWSYWHQLSYLGGLTLWINDPVLGVVNQILLLKPTFVLVELPSGNLT